MSSASLGLRLAVVGALTTAFVGAVQAGTHTDEKVGYKIKTPKDFERNEEGASFGSMSTVDFSDPYVLDTFDCTKELSVSVPTGGSMSYTRRMWTLYFPEQSAAELARKREEANNAKLEEGKAVAVNFGPGTIYQSFEEWAKARVSGFFFEDTKKTKIGGMPAVIYEMKFEKLSMVPQRWLGCAIDIPGGEFAVMFSLPEQRFSKYKGECNSCFKSFRMLDDSGLRSRDQDRELDIAAEDVFGDKDEDEMTPAELKEKRERQREEAFEKCLAELPKGWRSLKTDNYLVVYECDPKYAKKVGRQAEAVREWMAETFPNMGDGIVQAGIIKVYESDERIPSGHMSYTFGKGKVREIWFGEPSHKGHQSEFSSLNTRVMNNWLTDKNSELWDRMPSWLSRGLREYVEDAELKGSKVKFDMDDWERRRLEQAREAQKAYDGAESGAPLKPLKLLFTTTGDELFSGVNGSHAHAQCGSIVRYLIEGPGSRNSKTNKLIDNYIANLFELVDEVERKLEKERKERSKSGADNRNLSDEERLAAEDEEYRKRREGEYGSMAGELLTKSFAKTFNGWDEGDWRSLDHSWKKYADVD